MSETGKGKEERPPPSDSTPGYMRLEAWRFSDDLAVQLFLVTKSLPNNVRWLATQITRAATSAPANIAEGYGRLRAVLGEGDPAVAATLTTTERNQVTVEERRGRPVPELVDELAGNRHETLRILGRLRPEHLNPQLLAALDILSEHETQHAAELLPASRARRWKDR